MHYLTVHSVLSDFQSAITRTKIRNHSHENRTGSCACAYASAQLEVFACPGMQGYVGLHGLQAARVALVHQHMHFEPRIPAELILRFISDNEMEKEGGVAMAEGLQYIPQLQLLKLRCVLAVSGICGW